MITLENATVLYGENLDAIKTNMLIQDGEIVEVSPNIRKGKIIDTRECVAAPAFINSHVHLGDSVAMDMGDGIPIMDLVKPPDGLKHRILAETPPSVVVDSIKNSMWEMLRTGTATFLDFREGGFEGIDLLEGASEGIPIRKIVLGRHDSFLKSQIKPSEARQTLEKLLDSCDGVAPSGLGEIDDYIATLITETARNRGKLSAIHVAEYQQVQNDSLDATGKSEVQRAIEAGFNILIHLTAPLKDDLDLVARNKTPIVICPRSNGALAVGIPPVKEMLEAGIKLLLGTDNVMFNSPNMFREMEYALKVTRGYYKEYFPPREFIKMATVNAAQALKLNVGCIEEGRIADILLVEKISHDPLLSLINRTESRNIKGLITEGEFVYNYIV